jgi:multidrug resistance efflux pump
MVIIIVLYVVLVWLVFSKLKLIRWGWASGVVTVVIGLAIVGVFMALFNNLTPSGRIAVFGRVVEVKSNVDGQVVAIPVKSNVLVKAGSVLFQIDPAPYRFKARQLAASLAEAKQKVGQLKASVDMAVADVRALRVQWERADKRREDLEQLGQRQATSQFNVQDAVTQADSLAAQLEAANARETNARLAASSEIDGENTAVAQLRAQLDNAEWQLEQTTISAPADGYVTLMALAVGDRVVTSGANTAVMSFVMADDMTIIGEFQQNGFQTIKAGTSAKLVFSNRPGTVYDTKVLEIGRGIGQGQLTVSGSLARVGSIGTTTAYPVRLDIPQDIDRDLFRPGMSGSATVLSPNAGVIGTLASILLWVNAYMAYL